MIAGMENYLDQSDDVKVEIEALELLMDPEDSQVCLRFFVTHARRRGSRIFEIFSTKEKIDHSVASRNRWLEFQGKRVAQHERWLSNVQDVNCERTLEWSSSVPRKKDEDAAAAAEFFVDKGGRKPVEFSRNGGHRIAGESLG